MSTLTEAELTEMAERVERIAHEVLGELAQVRLTGTWAEIAAPWYRDGSTCPECPTQETGPAWDWIDDEGTGQTPWVAGTRGVQCEGCGGYGRGWVSSGARDMALEPALDSRLHAMAYGVERTILFRRANWDHRLQLELVRELADWLDDDVHGSGGTGAEPGIWLNGGIWEAWDYAAAAYSHGSASKYTIAVTEADLPALLARNADVLAR